MKNILTLMLFALLLLTACQPKSGDAEWPEDLAGKKALLKEKKTDLKTLEASINKLEDEIAALDTSKSEKQRQLVTLQKLERKTFKRFADIQATVQSSEAVMASSETGGRLTSMVAVEGQYVSKGQLIGTVDMQAVDKQIAELEKGLELAVDVFERQKRLWDQNIGSELQFLKAKNDKERIEKSLETVKFQLTKANVYAPIAGVVDMVFLKSGEMAGPGTPIVQIIDVGRVKVVASLPENYLGVIKKGATVNINFPALDEDRTARVSMIGRTINPGNRTFKVEVEMNNRGNVLKPNLLALMKINDFTLEDAVTLPLEMVLQEVGGKNFVYVKEESPDGPIAKKVYVETGESYEGEIVITSGLEGNEEVVEDGARSLTNNDLIVEEGEESKSKLESKSKI